ncbi:unnamed protein product [Gongylonema pulchrum]|uniref:ShKT domain-containing protein n=1 Tax=Gongylonema pulchrum TaxID=637853 RepID=A0A183EQS9_9BILA|nr:unnamed protein product [Gongylonema pulchrum]
MQNFDGISKNSCFFALIFILDRRATACKDLAPPNKPSECPSLVHLCNDPVYYELMTKQCPKTCRRCWDGLIPKCADLSEPGLDSPCPTLRYLCNDSLYYDLMTEQCPKTCGRCYPCKY